MPEAITEAQSFDVTKFSRIPCAIKFGNVILGGTDGPVEIKPVIESDDVTCNQARGRTIKKLVKKAHWEVTAKFKQPATVLPLIFGMDPTELKDLIGTDLYASAKTLDMVGIVKTGETAIGPWSVPAIATCDSFSWDGEADSTVSVKFETCDAPVTAEG